MNLGLKERFSNVLLIAEDSTAYPGVTAPISQNGLGFDYIWDLGWMNNTLSYFKDSCRPGRFISICMPILAVSLILWETNWDNCREGIKKNRTGS